MMMRGKRGFAAIDPARQREIARQGGQAAHKLGTAHEWSGVEAREAGRKGGLAAHRNRPTGTPSKEEIAHPCQDYTGPMEIRVGLEGVAARD
jgi:general stress protein YciG